MNSLRAVPVRSLEYCTRTVGLKKVGFRKIRVSIGIVSVDLFGTVQDISLSLQYEYSYE